jgi:predicted  nucleic acid-binding Zn-ribbon protein
MIFVLVFFCWWQKRRIRTHHLLVNDESENEDQQLPRYVVTDSPDGSESSFDVNSVEEEMEKMKKERLELEKRLKALGKNLLSGSPKDEEEDEDMEAIRQKRQDFDMTYNNLKRDLAKSLPASVESSFQSSPNLTTTTF